MAESVTALLFSPEELIQEESANLILHSKPDLYISASHRISDSIKLRLDKIINGTVVKEEFLFEKMQFLSKIFGVIAEDELLSLAGELKFIKSLDREYFLSSERCIIWPVYGDKRAMKSMWFLKEKSKGSSGNMRADTIFLSTFYL